MKRRKETMLLRRACTLEKTGENHEVELKMAQS